MRELDVSKITESVRKLCMDSNCLICDDILDAFKKGLETEESPTGKDILNQLIQNAKIAQEEYSPLCQDCGLAVVFIKTGQEVCFTGGSLTEAINEGVRQGYKDGYLRKSTCHPFTRANVGDNTPAVIHYEIVPGNDVKIIVATKGGGSENMSRLKMLTPAQGLEGVKDFVVETVNSAGPNPCPPTIIGVGVGGTIEKTCLLSKEALLRPIGSKNPDHELQLIEDEILKKINNLGIGPMGLGGRITSFAVHIKMVPSHIASLPVAVNIQCHSARHKEIIL